LHEEDYNRQVFVTIMKASALALNVYYFFFRRWCLPRCIANIIPPSNKTMTFSSQRLAIELIVILYLTGSCFVPGGHTQFQLWYQDLIPLCLQMSGLPSFISFKLYLDMFPCHFDSRNTHHLFLLSLCAYLLTIGIKH